MEQEHIDKAIKAYNTATGAHKRAPIAKYINKQLAAGEEVLLSAGTTRWSSALVFTGSIDKPEIQFRINQALPKTFQETILKQKKHFEELLHN